MTISFVNDLVNAIADGDGDLAFQVMEDAVIFAEKCLLTLLTRENEPVELLPEKC